MCYGAYNQTKEILLEFEIAICFWFQWTSLRYIFLLSFEYFCFYVWFVAVWLLIYNTWLNGGLKQSVQMKLSLNLCMPMNIVFQNVFQNVEEDL